MNHMHSAPGPVTNIDGKEYLYFCGTGYLCLQGDPRLIDAGCRALIKYGTGTATSRSGFGTAPPLANLEKQAASFFGAEYAFCFASGYSGPNVLLTALSERFDLLMLDEASHYSGKEAARLSSMKSITFRHRDPGHLAELLGKHEYAGMRPLVLTDGVFPISGAIAPLDEYLALVENRGGAVVVDDAHAIGVLGEHGRGTAEYLGIKSASIYTTATLSKAIGGHGGVIPCSDELFGVIRQKCGLFDGASPPNHAAAAASECGLRIAMEEPERRLRLQENARKLRDGVRRLGFDIDDSPVPVVSIAGKDSNHLLDVQQRLRDKGILIAFIERYSGVSEQGVLRIAVFSEHTGEMIERLLAELEQIL